MPSHSKNKKTDSHKGDSALKPDPETLHTTDPQENMEGPVSSFMQNIKEEAKKSDKISKEEADEEKDKNT